MRAMVAAFAAGAVLGMTGVGPVALIAALVVGAVLFWRNSGSRIRDLEMADELAGYDPHEPYATAQERLAAGFGPIDGRLAEAIRRNEEEQ